jgi:hypothetical protein
LGFTGLGAGDAKISESGVFGAGELGGAGYLSDVRCWLLWTGGELGSERRIVRGLFFGSRWVIDVIVFVRYKRVAIAREGQMMINLQISFPDNCRSSFSQMLSICV